MSELINKVNGRITVLKNNILPVTTDKFQFKDNIKNDNISKFLTKYVNNIETHFSYIGKEVYKYKNNTGVILIDDYEIKRVDEVFFKLNPLYPESFIYSIHDFETYEKEYTKFLIDKTINKLLNGNLYLNSTCAISNLTHQWGLESVQEIIDYLREIIE